MIDVLFAGVPISDLPRAIAWYGKLLGRPADIVPNDDEVMWKCSQAGWLYVLRDPDRAGHSIVTAAVADLDRAVADINARGIVGLPIERIGDAGRKARFTDPDGNEISLIEVNAPPEESQSS
jgi:predicted enzyme related to lactoylglutathione lyase